MDAVRRRLGRGRGDDRTVGLAERQAKMYTNHISKVARAAQTRGEARGYVKTAKWKFGADAAERLADVLAWRDVPFSVGAAGSAVGGVRDGRRAHLVGDVPRLPCPGLYGHGLRASRSGRNSEPALGQAAHARPAPARRECSKEGASTFPWQLHHINLKGMDK